MANKNDKKSKIFRKNSNKNMPLRLTSTNVASS